MKGNAAIIVIFGILAVVVMGFLFFKGLIVSKKNQTAVTSSPQSFSEDPKYKDVKEKYNLSEEQLQILSTVNPDDNN